jgi:uncharacterized protein
MRRNISFYLLTLTLLLLAVTASPVSGQDFPERPVPPRLVNDFAGLLNLEEINSLERKLVAFDDSTSTQIAIVILRSLNGYDIADYAQQLAEKWGIGQKGKDNGLLILVKPKTADSKGEVSIAQGYGLEGAIPDLTCSEIIDNEILPAFRNQDFYGGFDKATTTLMSLASGEFTASEYGQRPKKKSENGVPLFPLIIIIIVVIGLISGKSGGSNNRNISSGGLPFWLLLGMMNSGRGSHGGSWGGFSGGGGSGGGGGFGGFGGGSFGGGGASGSW